MKQLIYLITMALAIIISACATSDKIESDLKNDYAAFEKWQHETNEIFKYMKFENDSCFYDITLEEALNKGLSKKVFDWAQKNAQKYNKRIKEERKNNIFIEYHVLHDEQIAKERKPKE